MRNRLRERVSGNTSSPKRKTRYQSAPWRTRPEWRYSTVKEKPISLISSMTVCSQTRTIAQYLTSEPAIPQILHLCILLWKEWAFPSRNWMPPKLPDLTSYQLGYWRKLLTKLRHFLPSFSTSHWEPEKYLQTGSWQTSQKGDKTQAVNYRPVSLTSITCKTMEHIIYHHIMNHLELHNILSDNQHGFGKHRSCDN